MTTIPRLNYHFDSPASTKIAYRALHPGKVPTTPTPSNIRYKWIWSECGRQQAANEEKGYDMDFIMEEFYRCHPEVIDGDQPGGKEEDMGIILRKWARRGEIPIPGTRIIVTNSLEAKTG
ncbi:hypothetical protein EG328_000648 [Venturia inaequalis]|uniref:Uncharacterized protein n=1 Tax=Venturia inaequalis TaxID=5025 RepID=A0A8H3V1V7_VENIN|nr:hypothetical protein EG328_000648 [Venturia inaequalis]